MIKNSQRQGGNALVVVIIAIVLVLLGALAFIFWQNSTQDQTTSDSTGASDQSQAESQVETQKESVKIEGNIFTGDTVSFEYPKSWQKVAFGFTHDSDLSGYYPLQILQSTDYKTDVSGMSVDSGAHIEIDIDNDRSEKDFLAEINELRNYGYITFSENMDIDGVDAYQYTTNYEGTRNTTKLFKDGHAYSILMRQSGTDGQVAYDLMRDSWKWQ